MSRVAAPPIIGVTTSLSEQGQTLDCEYLDAVERAGGCPLILPMPSSRETLAPVVARVDGLVITGGPGIVAGLIGDLPGDLPPVPARRWQADRWAFELARVRNKPVLGICYGMQLINACLGGTIYADAQRQLGAGAHSPARNRGRGVVHDLLLEPGTLLAMLAGAGRVRVNSFHLQAVAGLGGGLRASARSPDGLVEGIESADGQLVGVQFHPERKPGSGWDWLFEHLVGRAAIGQPAAPADGAG
jgi:putative glutamine amidotransferase